MPKIDAIEDELKTFRDLPRNEVGAIAETYETLHGIVFVREIGRHYLVLDGTHQDLGSTLLFCADLIACNIIRLFKRAIYETNTGNLEKQGAHAGILLWIKELLVLSENVGNVLISRRLEPLNTTDATIPFLEELLSTYQMFCEVTDPLWADHLVSSAVAHEYVESDLAVTIHNFKLIGSKLRFHVAYRKIGSAFDAEYCRYVEQCLDSMASTNLTLLDQFRLLHQVPETLSFSAADLIERADASLRRLDVAEAVRSLDHANYAMDIILSALNPLIDLMYPSEYFKFRRNLGGTSGSQSQQLGSQLLRRLYIRLRSTYLEYVDQNVHANEQNALILAFFGLRHRIYRWRDQHLQLPRALLGIGTTSLMGSKNAPEVAQKMSETFARMDPFPEQIEYLSEWPPLNQLERKVAIQTGDVAKAIFGEVEKGRGGLAKRRDE
jgi:hypothetical protein